MTGNEHAPPMSQGGGEHESLLPWPPRQIIAVTLGVMAVAVLGLLLLRFYTVIFIVFVGIVLSIAISPLTEGLHRLRLPLSVSVIVVYALLLLIACGFIYLVAPLIIEQVTTVIGNLPHYYQALRTGLLSSSIILVDEIASRMPAQLVLQPPGGSAPSGTPVLNFQQFTDLTTRVVFIAMAVFTLAYYWTLNNERAIRALLLRFPMESRDNLRNVVTTMEGKVGAFLRGQAIMCLSVGTMMLAALLIIGLPYALSLALLAAVFEAIPILGPTLGAIPAVLVALATSPDKIVWVIIGVIIIQQIESNLLVPRVMDRSVGVNPVVTILAIVTFGSLLGIPGALLAIPLAAIVQVLISYTVFEPQEPPPPEQGRGKASVLRYEAQQLQQDVRKQMRGKDEVVDVTSNKDKLEDMIEAIATDVESLLAERRNAEAVEAKR